MIKETRKSDKQLQPHQLLAFTLYEYNSIDSTFANKVLSSAETYAIVNASLSDYAATKPLAVSYVFYFLL